MSSDPLIVGLGGTPREGSTTARVVRLCLERAESLGAEVQHFGASHLQLPFYVPESDERTPEARALIEAIRRADGLVVVSPGYHGGVSGMLKNALDYLEDLSNDERPYLEGRAVGCVACASGWQTTNATLVALRSIVHALRGWPTPLGVALNSALPIWDDAGGLADGQVSTRLGLLTEQVVDFARAQLTARSSA